MGKAFKLYVILVSVCILTVLMFVPTSHALASQPPIDTTKFVEGNIAWGPRRADPAKVYDTGSGELIFNVYETLIAWNRERYWEVVPVLAVNVPARVTITDGASNTTEVDLTDPTGSEWQSNSTLYNCVGYNDFNGDSQLSVGDVIYLQVGDTEYRTWSVRSLIDAASITLNLERYSYSLNIRTSPTINFCNESGSVVDTFDVDDAVYSLQRGLVQDQSGSPQWMFYSAFFGTMSSDPWDVDSTSRMQLAHLIDNAIEKNGTDLVLNLGIPFPDNAFKQTLSNTYGSIVSKEFSLSIGCWDGNLLNVNSLGDPDWWNSSYVRRRSRSPYDTTGAYRYVGTGPYCVSVFNQIGNQVVMQRNTGWWQGWPISGNGCPYSLGYLDTYEIDYIASWYDRKAAFISGAVDTIAVPRTGPYGFVELLNSTTMEPDLSLSPYMKTIKNLSPSPCLDALHFTFTINSASAYIGTGSFPNGIPTDFFNNTHVRKAFAYSINQTWYAEQTYWREAVRSYTPLIQGLYPDYRTVTSNYDINYVAAEAELKAAMFPGGNVWTQGFTLSLLYNEGNDPRRIACEMIRAFFQTLGTFDGRSGPAFTVNLGTVDWPTYLNLSELPIFDIGWLADFTDADNFVRPYMHSNGGFSYIQNYTLANGWGNTHGSNYPILNKDELVEKAFVTPDGSDRAKMYADLETIYVADCPSLPLPTPTDRRWCQFWVKGWYYNAMYPGTYMPAVYKYDDCWYDLSGPTIGVQDGLGGNMRDISILINHFNAKAPIPGSVNDPKWLGTYGNNCVDPYGDRTCNMRDIANAILHFNHKNNTLTP